MIRPDEPKTPQNSLTKKDLYERQMTLLDTFLAHGTITKAQYEKSAHDLTVKMGMSTEQTKK